MYKYCALYEFWGFFSYSFREKKKKKENIHKTKNIANFVELFGEYV